AVFNTTSRGFGAFFEEWDIILTPITALPTPKVGTTEFLTISDNPSVPDWFANLWRNFAFTPLANLCGIPAISLPLATHEHALPASAGIAEAGVEEAGIVYAEFTDQRIERHHLGSVIRRHLHGLFRSEDVELAGIEDEAAVGARRNRLPEFVDAIAATTIDVDDAGVALGAVADKTAGILAGEIDRQRNTADKIGLLGIDQPLGGMQRVEFARGKHGLA